MSLKYLLPAIQSRPEAIKISEDDFAKLLQDVQVGREKVPPQKAQEEFLNGCERLLQDLIKAYPTEAEPFLKPVTKKMAPDYEKVISEPMDFSTMSKKIKLREYRSKTAFARDLNLIWDNCLKYNSEPHPVRTHANFMKSLATHHLKHLSDKSELAGGAVDLAGGKKGSAQAKEGNVMDEEADADGMMGFRPLTISVAKTRAILSDGRSLLANRKRITEGSSIAEPDPKKQKKEVPSWFPIETVTASDPSEADWWAETSVVGSVLPPIEFPQGPPLTSKPLSQGEDKPDRPPGCLSKRISRNITLMQNMRETAGLLSSLASGGTEVIEPEKDLRDHTLRVREFKRGRKRSGDSGVLNEGMAAGQLRMATGVMLSHAGFEGCNSMALDFVSQIATDYLMGLGKTVGLYKDCVNQPDKVSAESIIERVLANNGSMTPKDLNDYVQDDVFRYGTKLEDMHKKLRQAFEEQVEPEEGADDIAEDDMLFGGIPGMGDMDDFLGLSGIGAIPKKLLKDRKLKAKSEAKEPEPVALEYPPPPPFIPLKPSAIAFQIGILRPFYQSLVPPLVPASLEEPDLPESEWDPTMTQLGAFGQVVVRGVGASNKNNVIGKKDVVAKGKKKRTIIPGANIPEDPISEPEVLDGPAT